MDSVNTHFNVLMSHLSRRWAVALIVGSAAIGAMACLARSGGRPAAVPTAARSPAGGLAPTPPMGWNSWNRFHCDIDARLIRETADAMVSSGMRDAGYEYVNIDDCWEAASRDANG